MNIVFSACLPIDAPLICKFTSISLTWLKSFSLPAYCASWWIWPADPLYADPRTEVRRLLDKYHFDRYKVYNFACDLSQMTPPTDGNHGTDSRVERCVSVKYYLDLSYTKYTVLDVVRNFRYMEISNSDISHRNFRYMEISNSDISYQTSIWKYRTSIYRIELRYVVSNFDMSYRTSIYHIELRYIVSNIDISDRTSI